MNDNKHIQSFNEHQENLNISDVSDSKKFSMEDLSDFGNWLDDNAQKREYYPMSGMSMIELVEYWLSSK